MGFEINPTADGGGKTGTRYCRAGRKLLWAAGVDWGTSRAGNEKIDVRFVCVQDPDDGVDVGAQIWETFTLTERAAWKLAGYARAVGHNEPFGSEDKETINNLLISRPVWCDVSMETRQNGDERPKPNGYASFGGDITEHMDELAREMEAWHLQGKERFASGGNTGGFAATNDDIPF